MTTNHDYVTGVEFKRWMDEESAFRSRLEKRVGDGFAEIKASVGRMEQLQREANGRTAKAEQGIAVMTREVEAIKSEDGEIARSIKSIQEHGCSQYSIHRAALGVLDGARSITDDVGDVRPVFRLPTLSRAQKTAAGVGISALLIPAVVELFKLGTALFVYLESHP